MVFINSFQALVRDNLHSPSLFKNLMLLKENMVYGFHLKAFVTLINLLFSRSM